jgi:hypothetical protein
VNATHRARKSGYFIGFLMNWHGWHGEIHRGKTLARRCTNNLANHGPALVPGTADLSAELLIRVLMRKRGWQDIPRTACQSFPPMFFTVPTVPAHEKLNKVAIFLGTVGGIHRARTVPAPCQETCQTTSQG